jgi:hypothetical protein
MESFIGKIYKIIDENLKSNFISKNNVKIHIHSNIIKVYKWKKLWSII